MSEIVIGYWCHKNDPLDDMYMDQKLTFPVENSIVDPEIQENVIAALKVALSTGYVSHYRGWSNCRLCDKRNGSGELEIIRGRTKYRIPEGYLHYLEDHNVGYDPMILVALSWN